MIPVSETIVNTRSSRPLLHCFCIIIIAGSSGEYNRTGMPPGDYTLRVIATDPISGERQVIRSRLWVHSDDANDPFCILYLRNRGWRVVKDIFIVDFAGTGAASRPDAAFECSLDRATHVPCE